MSTPQKNTEPIKKPDVLPRYISCTGSEDIRSFTALLTRKLPTRLKVLFRLIDVPLYVPANQVATYAHLVASLWQTHQLLVEVRRVDHNYRTLYIQTNKTERFMDQDVPIWMVSKTPKNKLRSHFNKILYDYGKKIQAEYYSHI